MELEANMEICNGKANMLGYCERCGQRIEGTSAYCVRLVEFKTLPYTEPSEHKPPTEKQTAEEPKRVLRIDDINEDVEDIIFAKKIRNEAIQECIELFNEMFLISPSDTLAVANYMKEAYFKMLKLKNK